MNKLEKAKGTIRDGKGTIGLILINLIILIILNVFPSIAYNLLLSPEISVVIQKPWTLLTVFFAHQIPIHFLLNIVTFFAFGLELEKITSSNFVVSLYLIAGIVGSLIILPMAMLIGTESLIAGASASVFAVVTAFAVMRPDRIVLKSKARFWALSLFSFNIIIMLFNTQTADSAAAHLAGIIVGLLAGFWMKKSERASQDRANHITQSTVIND